MERRTLLPRRFPSPLLLYGVAVVSTLLVLGVRLALDPILGREAPLLLFALAVLVSAWVGGWRSGALATALSAALGGYFFLDPERSFYVEGMTDRVRLVMFLALGALASAFCETLHWQWRRLEGEARERERAHAAERAQRRLLRVTLASIGDGVITTDVEGRVTSLNPVAEALTGWPEADALGQPVKVVFRAIDEGSRQIKESPSMRALKSGQIVGPMTPTVLIARDGTERDVEE
ncbi:MAG TPA: DUF4118 domain-containing protein, partial [Gemmataceae bacterium]